MSSRSRITVNGSTYDVEVIHLARDRAQFLISGRTFEVRHEVEVPNNRGIASNAPRRISVDRSKAAAGNTIVSPIPGLVVEIAVAVGQKVILGETVAKVEAMKMQNSIQAPRDGVIKEVCVKAGAEVSDGELLIVLEEK